MGEENMSTIEKGWQCPVCGTVYSPYISECSRDHLDTVLKSLTTTGIVGIDFKGVA